MRILPLVPVVGMVALAASCADLSPLQAGVCGNSVVDPNEACDTFGTGGKTACRPPGGDYACRFDCDPTQNHVCPTGYGCGSDNVCRRASGAFSTNNPLSVSVQVAQLTAADFAGDRHQDVVTQSASGLRVHFFAQSALDTSTSPALDAPPTLAAVDSLPITRGRIITGSLTDFDPTTHAELSSLIVADTEVAEVPDVKTMLPGLRPVGGGINVWRARSDKTIIPTIYPSFPVSGDSASATVIAGFTGFHGGDDLFVMLDYLGMPSSLAFNDISPAGTSTLLPMFPLANPVKSIVGVPPTALLGMKGLPKDPNVPCETLVTASFGSNTVELYPLCKPRLLVGYIPNVAPPNVDYPGPQVSSASLSLPSGAMVGGAAFVLDVNQDSHLDVLVSGAAGATTPVYVAYGNGAGSYFPKFDLTGIEGQMSEFVFRLGLGAGPKTPPLAVGFIDSDAFLDWVEPSGIHFGLAAQTYYDISSATAWTGASIEDLNRDGTNDVAAVSTSGLDFFNGTSTVLLNHLEYGFNGAPSRMAVGDFDGDLCEDLAVSVAVDPSSASSDSDLYVLYGRLASFPETPALQGRLPNILEMEPALISWLSGGTPDAVSSLVTISDNATLKLLLVSAIQGHTNRQLTSPFQLAVPQKVMPPPVAPRGAAFDAVVGQFLPFDANNPHHQLAAIAIDTTISPLVAPYMGQVWAVPATGDAVLDATTLVPSASQAEVRLDLSQLGGSRIVALDVDPAPANGAVGIDETVIFIPTGKNGLPGAMLVLGFDGTNWLQRGSMSPPPFDGASTSTSDRLPLPITVADIDGDGAKDILVFAHDSNGVPFAKVIFNDRTGSLDYSKAEVVRIPASSLVAVPIVVTDDGRRSVAALASDGVYIYSLAPGSRSFVAPKAAAVPLSSALSLVSLVGADVDGDGVDDLVVGSASSITVYRGVGKLP